MNRHLTLATCLLVISCCICTLVRAADRKITQKDVPPAVLRAFEQSYPKAKVTGYSKEEEKGITYYELETVDNNVKRDLLYTADGKTVEIEETVSMEDLPAAVADTFNKESRGAKASRIEKTTRGGKVTYEFGMGKGKPEIVLDSSGRVISGSRTTTPK